MINFRQVYRSEEKRASSQLQRRVCSVKIGVYFTGNAGPRITLNVIFFDFPFATDLCRTSVRTYLFRPASYVFGADSWPL